MTQEALKLALEALENPNSGLVPHSGEWRSIQSIAIAAIKEALAQPKKEPIAYINVEKRTLEFAKQIFWHTPTVANLDRIPLYTQRTWVGLTKEDIESWELPDTPTVAEFAWFVEAKLKDKNCVG